MMNATRTILVVDANAETRSTLNRQLVAAGYVVLEAEDGRTALEMVRTRRIGLVLSELYLQTGDNKCLLQAMRRERVRGTRTVAHTVHATSADKAWAKQWGASAFLIQPAVPERLGYVVSQLLSRPRASKSPATSVTRRDSLGNALGEIERGELHDTLAIIFGRPWWDDLSTSERNDYRKRARRAGVTLRSDAMMSRQFVELRTSRPTNGHAGKSASPYKG